MEGHDEIFFPALCARHVPPPTHCTILLVLKIPFRTKRNDETDLVLNAHHYEMNFTKSIYDTVHDRKNCFCSRCISIPPKQTATLEDTKLLDRTSSSQQANGINKNT